MNDFHSVSFPGESADYRAARNALLAEEIELRTRMEALAKKRRELPSGGRVPEDYLFEAASNIDGRQVGEAVRLSDCFKDGKDTLAVYTLMYGPNAENACPMCASFLDGLNGEMRHLLDRINMVVVAKSSASRIADLAKDRNWGKLVLLSSSGNSFNQDYHSESPDGHQWPIMHIFKKTGAGIIHRYSTELFYYASNWPNDPRHIDNMWGLWNVMDLTPEGRGTAYPSL